MVVLATRHKYLLSIDSLRICVLVLTFHLIFNIAKSQKVLFFRYFRYGNRSNGTFYSVGVELLNSDRLGYIIQLRRNSSALKAFEEAASYGDKGNLTRPLIQIHIRPQGSKKVHQKTKKVISNKESS